MSSYDDMDIQVEAAPDVDLDEAAVDPGDLGDAPRPAALTAPPRPGAQGAGAASPTRSPLEVEVGALGTLDPLWALLDDPPVVLAPGDRLAEPERVGGVARTTFSLVERRDGTARRGWQVVHERAAGEPVHDLARRVLAGRLAVVLAELEAAGGPSPRVPSSAPVAAELPGGTPGAVLCWWGEEAVDPDGRLAEGGTRVVLLDVLADVLGPLVPKGARGALVRPRRLPALRCALRPGLDEINVAQSRLVVDELTVQALSGVTVTWV